MDRENSNGNALLGISEISSVSQIGVVREQSRIYFDVTQKIEDSDFEPGFLVPKKTTLIIGDKPCGNSTNSKTELKKSGSSHPNNSTTINPHNPNYSELSCKKLQTIRKNKGCDQLDDFKRKE